MLRHDGCVRAVCFCVFLIALLSPPMSLEVFWSFLRGDYLFHLNYGMPCRLHLLNYKFCCLVMLIPAWSAISVAALVAVWLFDHSNCCDFFWLVTMWLPPVLILLDHVVA